MPEERDHVVTKRKRVQVSEVLLGRGPIPGEPFGYKGGVALEEVEPVRRNRLGSESAVTGNFSRDTLRDHRLRARERRQREVRMGVDVNKAGRQASVVSIDNLPGSRARSDCTDIGYSPMLDANVRTKPRLSSTVDHAGVPY